LVLKNVNVINVFSEEIHTNDIAICEGFIAGIGEYSGECELDLAGFYASPGFIDCHLHLESTLVTPREVVHIAAQCGTTTLIVDPHESANVAGCAGIDYILEQTDDVPANVFVMVPSCVPATKIDDNGARLTASELAQYLQHERVLGLGEVMDYEGVIKGEAEVHDKLELFSGKIIDGHAPCLSPADLSAYALAGITTDHECTEFDYAMEECRRGITVLIREGSGAKNLKAIVQGIVEHQVDTAPFCFCTDDKHIEEIQRDGHINYSVRQAVRLGIDPLKAIKMATIQAARCYGLKRIGAIAPGYQADLVIFDCLEKMNVQRVYHRGKAVPKNQPITIRSSPAALKKTVRLAGFSEAKLALDVTGGPFPVIGIVAKQITTEELMVEFPPEGLLIPSSTYQKIAVIERHGRSGATGVGVVGGFGLRGGAVASSVSHDSHNITVIGDNDQDMALAVSELIRSQGGYTIVEGGKVVATLGLPIMGLMSEAGFAEVGRELAAMNDKVHSMGVPGDINPFAALSFLALPVIPELRITTRGIYSVRQKRLLVRTQGERRQQLGG
jgi:adenine deaminase